MLSAVSVLLSEPYESLGSLIVALGSTLDQQQGSRFLLSRVTASKVCLTKLFKRPIADISVMRPSASDVTSGNVLVLHEQKGRDRGR